MNKKEFTVSDVEQVFDSLFAEIDRLTDDISETNSVSLKQIYEAYMESKN